MKHTNRTDSIKTDKYNGWTNRETWLVNLWQSNDQGSYEYWQEAAHEMWQASAAMGADLPSLTQPQRAVHLLAQHMEEEFDEQSQNMARQDGTEASGFWADLLGSALARVNWQEIAEHLMADVDKAVQS